MEPGHVTVLGLAALVVISGATAAAAVGGTNPIAQLANPGQASDEAVEREGQLTLTVDGTAEPGNSVTVTATDNGEPVRGATVEVNGENVGTTDRNGAITVTVPDADEFEVEVETHLEGSKTFVLEDGNVTTESADVDADDADEADEAGNRINLTVDGNVSAGENVTVTATHDGAPVSGAVVTVDGENVGTTAADGTITVTVPDEDEFEIEASLEKEGTLKVPLAEDEDEAEPEDDDEGRLDLTVTGTLDPGETVTVTATDNGTAVTNATVVVNGEQVTTTDADGTARVTIPAGEEFELTVTKGDLEAEVDVKFEKAEE